MTRDEKSAGKASKFAWVGAAALAVIAAMTSGRADAVQLDKAACAKLTQDLQALKALDVDRLMEHGPNWAVANLSAPDLNLVRQYIELDEQMKFRCMAPSSLVQLKNLEEEDEEGAKPQAGPDSAPPAAAGVDQPVKPKPKAGATIQTQKPVAQKPKPPAPAQAGVVGAQ
ncbi:hypothetical protein T281_14785 [Rhodomicrobium udaipurense JA643]|uniref:Uncharacterized protein n=1 Tax=Rhodomicrobium udaipurense TaxID=1202716 RepID=A0A8I1G972_9HYPH|nr:hypothetical protein [Rhodomicrobium udaipurense]KAI93759.1 hypothetical protein T281_14785 [Rhodomicrobium udaipurense JA643]MBJ7542868.1 hypothetical protein [Rhodomicrobium udaipurense]